MQTTLPSRDKSTIGFTLSFCLLLVSTRRPQRQTLGQTAAQTPHQRPPSHRRSTGPHHCPSQHSGRGATDESLMPGPKRKVYDVKALTRRVTKDLGSMFNF